jgi:hypothetical protein
MIRNIPKTSVVIMTTLIFFSLGFSNLVFGDEIESPRKQLEKGILPEEITCKPGNVLVILVSDKPACLKKSTVIKLEERGNVKLVLQEFTLTKETTPMSNVEVTDSASIQGNTGKTSSPYIENIPASRGSIVNFYITDDDLNASRNGIDIIETKGLLEFTINGISIIGPKTMIETGPNTGQFFVKLQLPDYINGRPLSQNDIVEIKYFDQSDASGENQISTKSMSLAQTFAQLQTSEGKTRIGRDFTVRIFEPDANLDSRDVDRISLSRLEYRGEGGIRTTLANPAFDANSSNLRESGENTGIFEVIIKIPRTIDGKTVHIGDWYEISYVDRSTPSNTNEEIKLKGKIG